MLLIVVVSFMYMQKNDIWNTTNRYFNTTIGSIVLLFVLFYMGLRPVDSIFVDMWIYNYDFTRYQEDGLSYMTGRSDILFNYFTYYCSQVMSAKMYFLICATLYVMPLYFVMKKWFENFWFYGFLIAVISFSFWAYGTNGIRNGIATSLFLLAISRDKWLWKVLIVILAINFHKTMLLPTIAYLLAYYFNRPKYFIAFWLLCIPFSLLAGTFFQTVFASFFEDERASIYLTLGNIYDDKFSSTGFRWDFLIYSATAVFAGWYYIFKKDYKDVVYTQLFTIYLFANAFWILVIRANFSNRFAYLSWFMLGIIIIYPLLKVELVENQHRKIGLVLIAYFSFTFLMNVILVK